LYQRRNLIGSSVITLWRGVISSLEEIRVTDTVSVLPVESVVLTVSVVRTCADAPAAATQVMASARKSDRMLFS
jgi:hypothetical protein